MINEKGTPLRIYSLDKEEDGPMDMLPFEKGIYCAFIEKGIVSGDTIQYKTNFGVTLNSFDNCPYIAQLPWISPPDKNRSHKAHRVPLAGLRLFHPIQTHAKKQHRKKKSKIEK